MTTTILAEGAADPGRGWGNLVGLIAGGIAIYVIWRIDLYRQRRKGGSPSPTPPAAPAPRETTQVTAVSSHKSHDETADDEGAWYGRIVRSGGKVYRTTKHIAKTGESPKPAADEGEIPQAYEPPEGEPEIDVPLDDDDPAEIVAEHRPRHRESRESYAARCAREGVPRTLIVAGLQQYYRVPRATAYRITGKSAGSRPAA